MDNNDKINFDLLSKYISENDVLVDVGANSGIYTDFFIKCNNNVGKVYTIELHPNTYNILTKKYKNNTNIIVENYGVSDFNGEAEFYLGCNSFTHNIIGHDMNFNRNNVGGSIKTITLDELLKNETKIRVIKIDVEGAELKVLKGMVNTIHKVDYILLECHLDKDWVEIRDLLLNTYGLFGVNISTMNPITNNSDRPYQLFIKTRENL